MADAFHLTKRFFGSINPKKMNAEETAWIRAQLLDGEFALWQRMSVADKRHSYIVGQRALGFLGEKATRPAIAAAILHDIGKIESGAGTMLRVVSTLVGKTATHEQREAWAEESGWLGKAGRYLNHNEIGAQLLRDAGSDPLTYAWAREHELATTEWTLPPEISDALYRADSI